MERKEHNFNKEVLQEQPSLQHGSVTKAGSRAHMGKKGKGKAPAFLTDAEALKPFDCDVRDIIKTPLGVTATVVGVKDGSLWLEWPGGIVSPASPAP